MREDWRAYKLDELGFVGRGRSRHRPRNDPSLYGGSYPFFQTGDIKEASLYLREHSQTYNEKGLRQSKLWEPGTLCITIAANIAETAILDVPGCFPDSVVGFVADPERADARFVKYYIDYIKLRMQSVSHGTTQDNLSLSKLMSFDFVVPPADIQRKIAVILSAYDDLIENNTRRIAILEEIAQLIYREWFVHFRFPGHEDVDLVETKAGEVPAGWEVVKLPTVVEINRANVHKQRAPEQIHYINISSVSPGRIDELETMDFEEAPSRARRIVQHGDTIWSTVRPNRRSYALVFEPIPNTVASTGFAVLTPVKVPFTYLYYAVTTDAFADYLTNRASGSAYPAVNTKDFRNAEVLMPPKQLAERFQKIVLPLIQLKENLLKKNDVLRDSRDLLLPRLVSGELNVSDLVIPSA